MVSGNRYCGRLCCRSAPVNPNELQDHFRVLFRPARPWRTRRCERPMAHAYQSHTRLVLGRGSFPYFPEWNYWAYHEPVCFSPLLVRWAWNNWSDVYVCVNIRDCFSLLEEG